MADDKTFIVHYRPWNDPHWQIHLHNGTTANVKRVEVRVPTRFIWEPTRTCPGCDGASAWVEGEYHKITFQEEELAIVT